MFGVVRGVPGLIYVTSTGNLGAGADYQLQRKNVSFKRPRVEFEIPEGGDQIGFPFNGIYTTDRFYQISRSFIPIIFHHPNYRR